MTAIRQKSSSLPPDQSVKVACSELLQGMFVTEVDRPWRETPFPPDGFHIRDSHDVERLRVLCKYVYIDPRRGVSPRRAAARNLTILSTARDRAPVIAPLHIKHGVYPPTRSVKQEIDHATRARQRLVQVFKRAIDDAGEDKELDTKPMNQALIQLRDSILRNPDAMVWDLNTSQRNSCPYGHSVRATVWALVLGRHIGLTKEDLLVLATGTLLSDIGMVRLPSGFVSRRGPFGRREFLLYRQHVELGLELLQKVRGLDPRVLTIVRSHHERHDGRGFPRQIQGDQIPLLARMAALAYRYDRLLHVEAPTGVSPATAAGRLYKQRNLHFIEQLVFELIQALGMYPTGSIVELASREIALVLEQNPLEKMLPKVAVITDPGKNILKKPQILTLREQPIGSERRIIVKSVSTGNYYIAPGNLGDHIFGKRIALGRLGIRI